MDSKRRQWLADRAAPRHCAARRVKAFQRDDVIDRLYRGAQTQADFRIVNLVAPPTHQTAFDVCADDENLYVSVLCRREGVGERDAVEVLFAPFDDAVGFLQFGLSADGEKWFNHHWPYRDGRPNLTLDPDWDVAEHVERFGPTCAGFVFFRFALAGVASRRDSVGFNVMRAHARTDESASWSYAGGSGFPDATCMGRLHLDATPTPTPTPTPPPTPPTVSPRPARLFQLQVTYDFPDELFNAPYSPQSLRREFERFRDAGVARLYWIDYPHLARLVAMTGDNPFAGETMARMGGDPMPIAARLARELGLEFFTVIKPYDLWCRGTQPSAEVGVPTLGGRAPTPDPFVEAHPDMAMRRHPAWMPCGETRSLTHVTLYADNDAPLTFDPAEIEIYGSADNASYQRCSSASVSQCVVDRPNASWTPAGSRAESGSRRVRCIVAADLPPCRFIAIQLPAASQPGRFGNRLHRLAEAADPITLSTAVRGDDFRRDGFEFGISSNSAIWHNQTEGIELRRNLGAGDVLGVAAGVDAYKVGMLEPGFAAVRDYWMTYVRRAVEAGVDGVDVRIAHHHGCVEWLSYAWADPVLAAFRRQAGRDPQACTEDYERARRIRGGFHTQFLRDASAMLHNAGMKLEHHLESRMSVPPRHDTYTQIHWDWTTWIDQRLIDGVNLKYLGPFNPWLTRQLLPRAAARGLPVHMIAAIGDPRTQPRTPEWTREMLDLARCSGFHGLNFYEAWVYLRTTPNGHVVPRGCAARVLDAVRQGLLAGP